MTTTRNRAPNKTPSAVAEGDALAEPDRDCPLCPRLIAYRAANAAKEPDWFNGAAPSLGPETARLLIVGLAPGLTGANRTGLPFTGDQSGTMLFDALEQFGLSAEGDRMRPIDAMITNAVRCVPPQNRPTALEVATCRRHLIARIAGLPKLKALLCLGKIAHDSVIRALGATLAQHKFAHGAEHMVSGLTVFDSYHCSRYNTQTKRLTPEMFQDVFATIRRHLDRSDALDQSQTVGSSGKEGGRAHGQQDA